MTSCLAQVTFPQPTTHVVSHNAPYNKALLRVGLPVARGVCPPQWALTFDREAVSGEWSATEGPAWGPALPSPYSPQCDRSHPGSGVFVEGT